jgi:hypothetical protein
MDRACSTNGEKIGHLQDIGGKPRVKGLLGRPSPKLVNSIKKDLLQIVCSGMVWIDLSEDRD